MAPQFVKPYVKTNKHDVADAEAEAIREAVRRLNMRFVLIKNIEQQAILSVHRVRQGLIKTRTAQASQIRGLLSELERQINAWHRSNELPRKLEKVPGIGPITASALVATIGDAKNFSNARQLAASMFGGWALITHS